MVAPAAVFAAASAPFSLVLRVVGLIPCARGKERGSSVALLVMPPLIVSVVVPLAAVALGVLLAVEAPWVARAVVLTAVLALRPVVVAVQVATCRYDYESEEHDELEEQFHATLLRLWR